MFNYFNYFDRGFIFGTTINKYNPYINYSWSQTLTVEGNQQIKDTGTSGLNLQQFFGQGCWFNGIDQKLDFETTTSFNNVGGVAFTFKTSSLMKNVYIFSNRTSNNRLYLNLTGNELRLGLGGGFIVIPFALQVNTVYKVLINFNDGNYNFIINDNIFEGTYSGVVDESLFTLNNTLKYTKYTDSYLYKDLYMFNRQLTQTEIDKYNNQPNQFFMDSLEDDSCILAMPMCEKGNLVRNYKNNTDYPISNYLTTCRTNAQRLPYGLQTSGFKRDTNGMILSKSDFLECDGVGIATRVGHSETVKVKTIVNPSILSGNVLSGGVSLTTTGMTLNQDNNITLENRTPTTTLTIGNGFSGTIKEYKEEK